MTRLTTYLPLLIALVSCVIYAETEYAKQDDINASIQLIQVDRYQDKINLLNYLKSQRNLAPPEIWELNYLQDKRDNLQKSK